MDKVISQRKLKKEMKELRALIDTHPDVTTKRVAYAMETAVRYVTEAGIKDWEALAEQARLEAALLRKELRNG